MTKFVVLFIISFSVFSALSFGGESTTECPMMREANERVNPKENLTSQKPKSKKKNSQVISM